jgi:hypothetical protein
MERKRKEKLREIKHREGKKRKGIYIYIDLLFIKQVFDKK